MAQLKNIKNKARLMRSRLDSRLKKIADRETRIEGRRKRSKARTEKAFNLLFVTASTGLAAAALAKIKRRGFLRSARPMGVNKRVVIDKFSVEDFIRRRGTKGVLRFARMQARRAGRATSRGVSFFFNTRAAGRRSPSFLAKLQRKRAGSFADKQRRKLQEDLGFSVIRRGEKI